MNSMKLVVLRERGSTVALVFLVVFILLFALPFVYTLRSAQEGLVFILGFFVFFIAMMLFGVYAPLKKRGEYRRAQNFAAAAGF